MIDFNELPQDGTALEQLTRELLLVAGLSPQWTGRGPDQGRDLIAEETATGPLGSFRRRWLVQCKHFAHSARSVSRNDIPSVVDDCRQVNADGYLLVCATYPSSGVAQKLSEISNDPSNRLITSVWDNVEIEKRLREPRGFALAHIFFPISMQDTPWRVYNTDSPSKWAAHYKNYFIYLNCRQSAHFPPTSEVEIAIQRLEQIHPQNPDELIRPRAVYFDEKHEQFYVFADYLVPQSTEPSHSPNDFERTLHDWQGLRANAGAMWYLTGWDIRLTFTNPYSEHYQIDHSDYYQPYLRNFERGLFRGPTIGDLAEMNRWV
jgi:hypothetical protein